MYIKIRLLSIETEVSVSHSVVSDSLLPHGAHQAPLSMGFSRQEYWSGLPFSPPGWMLLTQGLNPGSPALLADSLGLWTQKTTFRH